MSDNPEPLDAILAEMKEFCSGWSEDVEATVKVGLIYGWKCRIEEAARLERESLQGTIDKMRRAIAERAPGNAAAIREALERIRPLVHATGATPYVPECKELVDGALAIIDGALAAPAKKEGGTEDSAPIKKHGYGTPDMAGMGVVNGG